MSAPEPTVCRACDGEGFIVIKLAWGNRTMVARCDQCTCSICGERTDTPPECVACFAEEEARAARRSDV